jgi:hypothetical protein
MALFGRERFFKAAAHDFDRTGGFAARARLAQRATRIFAPAYRATGYGKELPGFQTVAVRRSLDWPVSA